MNRNRFALAAALTLAAFAAQADDMAPTGQFAASVAAPTTRAEVQAQFADYRQAGVNPWSTSYNPLKSFRSQTSREQVTAEYLASRNTVAAMTGEDSGSAFLAAHQPGGDASRLLAGQPTRAAQ